MKFPVVISEYNTIIVVERTFSMGSVLSISPKGRLS